MDSRLSEATQSVVDLAAEEARRSGSGLVGTEHLLLGLLAHGRNRAAGLLLGAGATFDGCRSKVVELAGPPAAKPPTGTLDFTDRARRTLERADRLSLRLRAAHVEPEHMLVPLLDVEGRAGQVLRGVGVDVSSLRDAAAGDTAVTSTPPVQAGAAVPSDPVPPRCAACGVDISEGLAHRVVRSHGVDGGELEVVIAYCSGCGTAVGVVGPG